MLPFTRPDIGKEEIEAVVKVLESGWITTGPKVIELENELSDFLGGKTLVRLFNSGTSAMEAALMASDIGPGDEVIVPALSFAASANVILRVGAHPVFVDVDLHSRNTDINRIKHAFTGRTKAILPVHFSGLAVDMTPVYEFAETNKLVVIEDAAHAIGTHYKDQAIGASGNPVCFSFHPNKNMTTIEGGAIACSDERFMKRIERIRFHGIERDQDGLISVTELGAKSNLPDVNAALGLVQLGRLPEFNKSRMELAQSYFQRIRQHPALILPADGEGHSWHMFCVCIDFTALGLTRRDVEEHFKQRGINVGMHYPAIHLFPLYRQYGYGPGDFPNAEQIGKQTFSLPLFPAMTHDDVQQVCDALNELFQE